VGLAASASNSAGDHLRLGHDACSIWWLWPSVAVPIVAELPGIANVVPIWTDVENATWGDLLLRDEDVTFGGRWLYASMEFVQGPDRTGTQLEQRSAPSLDW
jgi:hypothetical protein